MGVCLSTDEKQDRDRSQQIDRQLEEDNKRLKRECKILLLGKEQMSVERKNDSV
jgi:guanine nucleotide-binding protein G(i) subunit alpha